MFSVGAAGYVYMTSGNVNALLNSLKNLAYARLSNYDLVVNAETLGFEGAAALMVAEAKRRGWR